MWRHPYAHIHMSTRSKEISTRDPEGTLGLLRRAFRHDAALRYGTLAHLGVIALFAGPAMAGIEVITWDEGNLFALLIAIWALRHRLREVADEAERRFWSRYSLAFASWAVAEALVVLFPEARHLAPIFFLEKLCYLAYYSFFLSAIEIHPHRVFSEAHLPAWKARQRFEIQGGALFVIGLIVYYILIPSVAIAGVYEALPSVWLYLTFEILIIARAAYACRVATGMRWRTIYRFVLLTAASIALFDTFDLLASYSGNPAWDARPPLLQTLWYAFVFPLAWGARLRHFLPSREATETTEETLIAERTAFPFSDILLLYASTLPFLHVLYQYLGILTSFTDRHRALAILLYILVFAQLMHRRHRYERGRSLLLELEQKKSAERKRLVAVLKARSVEMGHFSDTVAHDLKAPLITVEGFMGLLVKDITADKTDRVPEKIQRIREATGKMKQLVDELLELSRSGRIVGELHDVSLRDVAREAVGLVAGQISEKQVKVEISPDLPIVFGDRIRLVQVLQNLIDNAAKYMDPHRTPRIEISVRYDNDEPVFYVRDNGIGIAPEDQETVFGAFEQLDPNSKGAGIGLAHVKRIINVHGGRIWVESEGREQGCAICFTLPLG